MSNGYTPKEILGWLKMDKTLRLLLVEGPRDLAFWRKASPVEERKNAKIYGAHFLNMTCNLDGNRGKLIDLAKLPDMNEYKGRYLIFVDADNYHILKKDLPEGVIATDYRDLESYGFDKEVIEEVIKVGLAKENLEAEPIMEKLEAVCRPIGALRALSESKNIDLPFQRTFDKDGRRRFIDKSFSLDLEKLIGILLQNSGSSLKLKAQLVQSHAEWMESLKETDSKVIMQGKDWMFFFGELIKTDSSSAEALVFMGINIQKCMESPALRKVAEFLIGEQPVSNKILAMQH